MAKDRFVKIGVVKPTISSAAGRQLRLVRQMSDTTATGVYVLTDEDDTAVYVGETAKPIAERMKLSVMPGQGLYKKLAKWAGKPLSVMRCVSGESVADLIRSLEPATNRPAAAIKVTADDAKAKVAAKPKPAPKAKTAAPAKAATPKGKVAAKAKPRAALEAAA